MFYDYENNWQTQHLLFGIQTTGGIILLNRISSQIEGNLQNNNQAKQDIRFLKTLVESLIKQRQI